MTTTSVKLHLARRNSMFRPSILALVKLVGTWQSRARQRHDLAALTDEQLADIGISRSAARNESGKPFWRE